MMFITFICCAFYLVTFSKQINAYQFLPRIYQNAFNKLVVSFVSFMIFVTIKLYLIWYLKWNIVVCLFTPLV